MVRSLDTSGSETRTFKLAGIIPGWLEALQLMPVGLQVADCRPPRIGLTASGGMGQTIMPN